MKLPTNVVIERLARTADPVKPLPLPWRRTALWLAISLPYLALVWLVWPRAPRVPNADGVEFFVEQIAALFTGVTAATAAFATTIPGAERRLIAPVIALGVWLLTLGQGCVHDLATHGASSWPMDVHWSCVLATVAPGIVPAVIILVMIRRGAPLAPRLTMALAAVAAAGLANVVARLMHAGDASLVVLVWHLGIAGVVTGLAALAGGTIFNWPVVLQFGEALTDPRGEA